MLPKNYKPLHLSGNPGAYGITLINHPMQGTNVRLSQAKMLVLLLTGRVVVVTCYVTSLDFDIQYLLAGRTQNF